MSKPKPAIGSVKRRGLTVATAVAVAGSGFIPANYAFAEEANDQSQEVELKAPTVDEVFESEKTTINVRLKETQNPVAVAQEVAGKFKSQFGSDAAAFNQFEWQLERKVKEQFATLVANDEVDLDSGYSLPSAKDYFKSNEEGIAAALRPADGSEGLSPDEVVEKYAAELKRSGLLSVDNENAWKAEFRQLVSEKERELYPEYFAPSAQDYFDHHSGAIVAALRPADVSKAPGADAVAEQFVAQAQREGFSVDDAWKAEFRELVQQLADKLEAEEADAHRAVLNNELGVNSNPVVDPNEESLTAEGLAVPFAEHRDVVAEREAAEAGAHRAVLNNELGVNSNPVVDPNEESLTAEGLAVPFAEHRDVVAEREAAEELVESKEAAVAAIEGAVYLTENQKSQFIDRVNASAAVADVAAVVDQAHKLSDKQAAEEADKGTLAKDKGEAHRIIDGLNKLSLERKATFKKQVDDANTGAYVAHIVERAQELSQQQKPSGGVDEQESSQPGKDEKPGTDPKLGSAADTFKSFFDYAAGLGVFAPIFGRFGVILENLRNAFAKTGIRF